MAMKRYTSILHPTQGRLRARGVTEGQPVPQGKALRRSRRERGPNRGHTSLLHPPPPFADQRRSPGPQLLLYTDGLLLQTRLGLRLPHHPPNPGGAAYRETSPENDTSTPTVTISIDRFFPFFPCLYFLLLLPHAPPWPRSYLRPVSSPRLPRRKMAAPAQRRPRPPLPAAPLPPGRLRGLSAGSSPAPPPSPWPRYPAGPGCRCRVVGAG